MEDICSASSSSLVGLVALGLYAGVALMALAFARVHATRFSRQPMSRASRGLVMGGVMVVGIGAYGYWVSETNKSFRGVLATPAGLSLLYHWPKTPVIVAAENVQAVSVVRGRHFTKGSRADDGAYLWLSAGQTHRSCEDTDIARVAAAGRKLSAVIGKPLRWLERCPDPNNLAVPSDEATVTASGKMVVPAGCASAH